MKRLISFLGTGRYEETTYQLGDSGNRHKSRFVVDALSRLLGVDEVVLLATDSAWNTHGEAVKNTLPENVAFRHQKIPEGQSEKELWVQFDALRQAIIEDKPNYLALDITHGFRAQPFFAAGVLMQLSASGQLPPECEIYYGEYRKDDAISPIWNISLLTELMSWVQGTTLMCQTGNGSHLVKTLEEERALQAAEIARSGGRDFPKTRKLIKAIKCFSDDLSTVRIASLITGYSQDKQKKAKSSALALKEALAAYRPEVKRWLPALIPLLERLEKLTEGLYADSLASEQGLRAMQTLAKRYLELGRYPEAVVVVREGWVSSIGDRDSVEVNSSDFSVNERKKLEKKWLKVFGKEADRIARIRNDIEHGGFNNQPRQSDKLPEEVRKLVEDFTKISWKPTASSNNQRTTTYLLNSPVLTDHGLWRLSPLEVEKARDLAAEGFVSAIGHEASAKLLGEALRQPVPVVRERVSMQPGDRAIVFRLLKRLPEGAVLSLDDLQTQEWELALLERLE